METRYHIIKTHAELKKLVKACITTGYCSYDFETNAEPIYKLYPTRNMWNFLKLDTRNGKISIVQFSVEDNEKQFEYELSNKALCENNAPGRFMLQPTENIYNFIMLDQVSGKTYQVQWSFEEDKRFFLPIN